MVNKCSAKEIVTKFESMLFFVALLFMYDIFSPDLTVKNTFHDYINIDSSDGAINTRQLLGVVMILYALLISFFCRVVLTDIFLTSYFLWLTILVFLSVAWSEFFVVSLTRSILWLFAISGICLLYVRLSLQNLVKPVFFSAVFVILIVNLFAIIAYPQAAFMADGAMKGIHASKNTLGAVSALMVIALFFSLLSGDLSRRWRWFLGICLLAWFALLVLSLSKTSLALALIICLVGVFLGCRILFYLGMSIAVVMFFVLGVFVLCSFVVGENILLYYADSLPPDLLTGRGFIWSMILEDISESAPWLGVGYGAYWSTGVVREIFDVQWSFLQVLNSAHNGYLHVLTNFGVLGFVFFMALTLYKLVRYWAHLEPWELAVVVFVLWHAMTETDFMIYKNLWIMFVMFLTRAEYTAALDKVDSSSE